MYFRDSTRRHDHRVNHSTQLVECYRHPETPRASTQVIASLGDLTKLEEGGKVGVLVSGQSTGRSRSRESLF